MIQWDSWSSLLQEVERLERRLAVFARSCLAVSLLAAAAMAWALASARWGVAAACSVVVVAAILASLLSSWRRGEQVPRRLHAHVRSGVNGNVLLAPCCDASSRESPLKRSCSSQEAGALLMVSSLLGTLAWRIDRAAVRLLRILPGLARVASRCGQTGPWWWKCVAAHCGDSLRDVERTLCMATRAPVEWQGRLLLAAAVVLAHLRQRQRGSEVALSAATGSVSPVYRAEALYLAGGLLALDEQWARGLPLLQEACRLLAGTAWPDYVNRRALRDALYMTGECQRELGRYVEGTKYLIEAAALSSGEDAAHCYLSLGQCAVQLNDNLLARECFRRAMRSKQFGTWAQEEFERTLPAAPTADHDAPGSTMR